MSLNTAHCNGGVLVHQGEVILLHASNAVLSFSGSDELKFGEKTGNAYLTTHRLIFLPGKGHNSGPFQSFSFPFCVLSEVDVEQPMFGANFLKGKVRAQPDGNWRGEAKFKLVFKSGGAIDFAQGMVRAMQLARQMTAQSQYWNTPPPSYSAATAPGSFQQAPPSYYASQNNYYGWMPPAYNFPAPEAGTVFVSEAPPPYPGIGGQAPAYPQQPAANPYSGFPAAAPAPQQNGNGANPQQTYGFNPTNAHGAGMPFQANGYVGGMPQANGYGAGMPQANGYGGGGMPPQNNGYGGGMPQAGGGFYPPATGYAYANGTQAFVPPPSAAAPPPYMQYDPNAKKND